MPSFSQTSKDRLATCHEDLQIIFNTVIKMFDCTIIAGHRGRAEQDQLYLEGKTQLKFPISNHNKTPSMAVDAAPYPIDWKDRERFTYFAGFVKGIAAMLFENGTISHRLRWGGDWDQDTEVKDNSFDDLPHFELVGE